MRKPLVVLIVCCFVQMGLSQSPTATKLNSYFEALEQSDRFMGSVSVSRAGGEIYAKSVGFSDVDSKVRANQSTIYMIGSISKSFTAVMIFQAIESGKITLATPLSDYIPNIKNAESITVDNLLTHRSGIHNFTDNNFPVWATQTKSRDELVKIIADGGSDFTPNSRAQYSNSNYVLLSYILEDLYNKSFSEILRMNIVAPLELKSTSFGELGSNVKCKSYRYFDKWRIESDVDPSVLMGAGGILSTANELNIFFQALFNGRLISQRSLDQMKTMTDGIGRGLFQIPFGTRIGYGHTGGIAGFSSISAYFPDDHTSYSLVSNGANYVVNNISIAVLSAIYDVPFEIPNFTVVNYTSEDLDKYLGLYSSSQLPIKLTVTKRDRTLVAQGTGQASFDLEASSENTFRFDQGGIIIVFDPCLATLILKQGGASFPMTKE